jgi:hypothetical protein
MGLPLGIPGVGKFSTRPAASCRHPPAIFLGRLLPSEDNPILIYNPSRIVILPFLKQLPAKLLFKLPFFTFLAVEGNQNLTPILDL